MPLAKPPAMRTTESWALIELRAAWVFVAFESSIQVTPPVLATSDLLWGPGAKDLAALVTPSAVAPMRKARAEADAMLTR